MSTARTRGRRWEAVLSVAALTAAATLSACTSSLPPSGTPGSGASSASPESGGADPGAEEGSSAPDATVDGAQAVATRGAEVRPTSPPVGVPEPQGIPPVLSDGWQLIEDPAAPAHGFVASNGRASVWLPGFEAIPLGAEREEGEIVYIDPVASGTSAANTAARYQLSITPIPRPECTFPQIEELDLAEVQALSDAFANCVVDAWRPLAEAAGGTLDDHYPVYVCDIPGAEPSEYCNTEEPWNQPGGAWYDASRSAIYLSQFMMFAGMPPEYAMGILTHEVAHLLQSKFVADAIGVLGTQRIWEPSPEVASRRIELHAQCLASGMLANPQMTLPELEKLTLDSPLDDRHWGVDSLRFWVREAFLGYVGDCDTGLAVDALLAPDPVP